MDDLYTNSWAALGSKKNLRTIAKEVYNIDELDVDSFLHSTNAYTKFGKSVNKFKRLSAYSRFINDVWCIDLAYVDDIANHNDGVKFILVCVDIFSRYVFAEPLKDKTANSARSAFLEIIFKNKGIRPQKVWCGKGTEFKGTFKQTLDSLGIKIYQTNSETKAAFAERAIQSLKKLIYKYLELAWTWRYIYKLDDFVLTMNTKINSAIGLAPIDVTNQDFLKVHYNHPRKRSISSHSPKFKTGDKVRISAKGNQFRKGYLQSFSTEVFKILGVATKKPIITYTIQDKNNEIILGKFYERELMRVI
ncbi:MAG: transposase family protein [Bacteroidota bacterium]